MFGQKSGAFGQNQQSSFSFGQSAFSKPATTGFGGNTFGAAANTSVFGAQPVAQTMFGQASTPQPGFGSSFGQPQQTSIFGATSTTGTPGTSLFGSQQTSAFNTAKPTGFGFGQPQASTSLFGQTQPQQQAPSLFGQAGANTTSSMSTGGGLFNTGATTSAFGQQNQQTGTAVAKFQAPNETDTLVKGSSTQYVQTKQQCITFMKEYAEKSLEELRAEDYAANRKGPQQQAVGGGLFGSNVQQNTGMFGQTQQPGGLFGQQPAQPSTGLFGSNALGAAPAFGATNTANTFGQTPGGLFGKPLTTPATTSSGFGSFGTTQSNAFGFNKPIGQATPSLFGQQVQPSNTSFGQQPTQNTFGTASTFGQPVAQNNLFGQVASSAQPAPAFGSTLGATSQAGSSGFNFGNNNQTQNAGGLFGANKPAFGATTGFGAAPATSTAFPGFGTSNPATGGLFASAAKPPAFGLGQPQVQPFGQQTGGSLFGTTSNQTGGGLFGSNTNPSGGGLFGSSNTFGTSSAPGGLFASSQPSMFNTAPQQQPQQSGTEIHQKIFALTSNPYGDNDLFKNLKVLSDDALKATNPMAQKALLDTSNNFKISPNSSSKIKVKPISAVITKKSLFDGLEENDPSLEESFTIKPNPKRLIIKPRASVGGANKSIIDDSINRQRADDSMKIMGGKENEEIFKNQIPLTQPLMDEDTDRRVSWLRTAPSQAIRNRPKLRETTADTTINQLVGQQANKEADGSKGFDTSAINNSILNETFNSIEESQLEPDISLITGTAEPHPTGIVLRRAGYYTIPSLDDLIEYMDEEGRCIVPNFAVGRRGYGNVYFDAEIDVSNLNLDEICHFRNKEITLYQDDDNKPPVGEELNRKAQVTLDQIWPHDKNTREPIKDPAQLEIMAYEAKLRRICEKRGTKFLEYRPETGSCVFMVDHFSKYTLDDSDDEGTEGTESEPRVDPKKLKIIPNGKKAVDITEFNRSKQPESTFILGPHPGQRGYQSYPQTIDIDDPMMREPTSPSIALAKEMKTDTHKLQLMKASFFVDEDYDTRSIMSDMTEGGRESPEQMVPSNIFGQKMMNFGKEDAPIAIDSADESEAVKETPKRQEILPSHILKPIGPKSQPLIVRPRVMLYDISDISLPVKESIIKAMINEKNASIPFLNGRKFKIGWNSGNQFTILSSQSTKSLFKGRNSEDFSKSVIKIQQIKSMKTLDVEKFKKSILDHLKIELKHDKRIVTDTTDCHRLESNGGTEGLYEHFELAQKLAKEDRENSFNATVWSLMQALWGSIEDQVDAQDHTGIMMRCDFFSNWLENVVLDNEISKSNLDYLDRLINLFMCHKISDACELALENDDMNLSLLIAQTGGGPAVKQLIQHQLCCWHEVEADKFIDDRRLRVLMMVGGVAAMESPDNSALNIFENHNWLKCLALQLWYVSSPIASVTDALIAYEQNFENEEVNVAMPLPVYKNQLERDRKYFDIRYHLLKLFSQRSHPLETLLHPAGYSTDFMDYRLSFFIAQVLESLGYQHLGDSCKLKIYTSLAEQLETYGLWEWSIWILLHIVDQNHRESAIQQLLYRHIRIDDELDIGYSEKEKFILDELQIPEKLIFWSKAVRAGAMSNHQVELKYLLKAQQWSKAHDVMMQYIAPDLVINDQMDYLKSLLNQFESTKEIQNWKIQGEILLNFIVLNEKFVMLSQNIDEDFDEDRFLMEISPRLSELCSVIRLFPCPTPKHRLCQCEIAKQLAFIIRNFYATSNAYGNQAGSLMRTALERLPLPQEYAQQELKCILATFLVEKLTTE